jgi:hypothetical protein
MNNFSIPLTATILWLSLVASAVSASPTSTGTQRVPAAAATLLSGGRSIAAAGQRSFAPNTTASRAVSDATQSGPNPRASEAKSGPTESQNHPVLITFAVVIFLVLSVTAIGLYTESKKQEKLDDAARDALATEPGDKSPSRLQKFYLAQMSVYQNETRKRARSSFACALIAMFSGLAFVIWGGFAMGSNSVAGASIGGLGGALSAFITKTFLDVHRVSLSQLNRYFRQPVIRTSVIEAQQLADLIGDKKVRQEAYLEIIGKVIMLIRDDNPGAETEPASVREGSATTGKRRRPKKGAAATGAKEATEAGDVAV